MLLKDFIAKLQTIYDEAKGTHHFDGKVEVEFFLDDPAYLLDLDIELVPQNDYENPVRPWRLMGCGCWAGAQVHLQIKRKEAKS